MNYSTIGNFLSALKTAVAVYIATAKADKKVATESFNIQKAEISVTTTLYDALSTKKLVEVQAEFAKFPKELNLEFKRDFVKEPGHGFGGKAFPLEEKIGKSRYDAYIQMKKDINDTLEQLKAGFRVEDYNRGGFDEK